MTGGSLGLRSGSYGSLQQQLQNSVLPIQTTPPTLPRKTSKMLKDKEKLIHWIFKFAGRKKFGMLFLSVVSAAVFVWVLYVGKGEDNVSCNTDNNVSCNTDNNVSLVGLMRSESIVEPPPPALFLGQPPPPAVLGYNLPNNVSIVDLMRSESIVEPPPAALFLGAASSTCSISGVQPSSRESM
ncbi:hypothetical protein L1049_010360 [Liquidambar formosana]|uniref:Uncharacterized protein n=1 Tax=Liquidambar formosana TaxID=63359 RepID=A0AAP0N8D6_LIQFO